LKISAILSKTLPSSATNNQKYGLFWGPSSKWEDQQRIQANLEKRLQSSGHSGQNPSRLAESFREEIGSSRHSGKGSPDADGAQNMEPFRERQ
jgi:hypothetical protein